MESREVFDISLAFLDSLSGSLADCSQSEFLKPYFSLIKSTTASLPYSCHSGASTSVPFKFVGLSGSMSVPSSISHFNFGKLS